jgi:hypothetical protein
VILGSVELRLEQHERVLAAKRELRLSDVSNFIKGLRSRLSACCEIDFFRELDAGLAHNIPMRHGKQTFSLDVVK